MLNFFTSKNPNCEYIFTWNSSKDKLEGESRMNPPLRNDQHPLLAKTVPMQS